MILVDTSVAVAAALSWHESHEEAVLVLPARRPAIAHVMVETYSVLTRLPAPHRVAPRLAHEHVMSWFTLPPIALDGEHHVRLFESLARVEIAGGAVYDAIVAATSAAAGGTLLTLDRRAARTYEAIGADYRLVGSDAS